MYIRQSKKKMHHYVPEFYLKKFVDPNTSMIWVYEKTSGNVFQTSPNKVAKKRYYYSFITENEETDSEAENFFNLIEGEASKAFEKIINEEELNNDEKWFFSIFISTMLTRVPYFRNNIELSASEINQLQPPKGGGLKQGTPEGGSRG